MLQTIIKKKLFFFLNIDRKTSKKLILNFMMNNSFELLKVFDFPIHIRPYSVTIYILKILHLKCALNNKKVLQHIK